MAVFTDQRLTKQHGRRLRFRRFSVARASPDERGENVGEQTKRIVFNDAGGEICWFSTDQVELGWVDMGWPGRATGEFEHLCLLPGNKWLVYNEPATLSSIKLTEAHMISEREAIEWLLKRGHEPPACLTAALNERCVVQPKDKRNENLFNIQDEDDGNRFIVLDVSGAQKWGPVGSDSADYDPIDQLPTWYYEDYLYRLVSGRFVRVRYESHREADLPFPPSVKRLTSDEAAKWILFGAFELPADIAHLAARHRFQEELPPRSASSDNASQTTIRWNKETCELTVNGNVVRRLRGRKVAKNVATVLDCFDDDGWPQRIDSPFTADDSGMQTCRETIRSLNEGLRLIRFSADGSGEGILWKLVSTSPTSRATPEFHF